MDDKDFGVISCSSLISTLSTSPFPPINVDISEGIGVRHGGGPSKLGGDPSVRDLFIVGLSTCL